MGRVPIGGGFKAIWYTLRKARQAGGFFRLYRALRRPNACKTCALGMGGQRGGMVDEAGHFPEVCKKSIQAMAADMQGRIADEFFARHSIDQLRALSPRELESLGRIAAPLYAGPGETHYRPISWAEATRRCVERLRGSPPDSQFFYSSGRSSNEAAFLLQLFARQLGTNNVNNCSYYCHQASGVGLASSLGTGTATVRLEDLDECDLVFVIGGNPASNHPRLMRTLMKLRRRGGKVIAINPLREAGLMRFAVPSDVRSLLFGSDVSSLYIQPNIGGDLALLLALAKRIDEMGAVDAAFLAGATDGSAAFIEQVRALSWEDLTARSGVDRATIDEAAAIYAQSQRAVFAWTMGITHHVHGVDNVRAIANLALLRGMVGRPGAGLLPIRGHSNVQGVGSVGVAPALKDAFFQRLESHFGVRLPTSPGLDTLACMEAINHGSLSAAWCIGGNLFGANPDAKWATSTFAKVDWVAYVSTTMNTGHAWGRAKETLILPALARDEEQQPTTQESMFSYVRYSEGGPRRLEGPRSEIEIIADWAIGALDPGPVDWASMREHRTIRHAIAAIVPGYEAIAGIDDTKKEFQIAGRTFHETRFPTPSGRAQIVLTPLPAAAPLAEGELRLMTIRSEGQFNTVVYEEEDVYRGQDRRDVILMSRADIDRLGLKVDQRVVVRSAVGEMRGILVRAIDIRPGNAAMYYPEANVIVPRTADPESRTPAFKSVVVTVHADVPAGLVQLRT
jgi:molybdopterin-dependent oxidoreductase alpha subunit